MEIHPNPIEFDLSQAIDGYADVELEGRYVFGIVHRTVEPIADLCAQQMQADMQREFRRVAALSDAGFAAQFPIRQRRKT